MKTDDNLPEGVTAAGMVVYKFGFYGMVIALANEPNKMNWYTANGPDGAAKHTPAVAGRTWRVPSQSVLIPPTFRTQKKGERRTLTPHLLWLCENPLSLEVGSGGLG